MGANAVRIPESAVASPDAMRDWLDGHALRHMLGRSASQDRAAREREADRLATYRRAVEAEYARQTAIERHPTHALDPYGASTRNPEARQRFLMEQPTQTRIAAVSGEPPGGAYPGPRNIYGAGGVEHSTPRDTGSGPGYNPDARPIPNPKRGKPPAAPRQPKPQSSGGLTPAEYRRRRARELHDNLLNRIFFRR